MPSSAFQQTTGGGEHIGRYATETGRGVGAGQTGSVAQYALILSGVVEGRTGGEATAGKEVVGGSAESAAGGGAVDAVGVAGGAGLAES